MNISQTFTLFMILILLPLAGCSSSASEIERRVSGTQTAIALAAAPEAALAPETANPEETGTPLPLFSGQTVSADDCVPGSTIDLPAGDVDPACVDLVKIDSFLEMDELTVVFHLREIPEEITIDQEGVPSMTQEYSWWTAVDLMSPASSGDAPDCLFSLDYVKMEPSAERTVPFHEAFRNAAIFQQSGDGTYMQSGTGTVAVDYGANTISISGRIPGIMETSHLQFGTLATGTDGSMS